MNKKEWPALQNWYGDRVTLKVEHAIWGKVHRQKGFRWIAQSEGFKGSRSRIEAELRIGNENQPTAFPLWKCENERYYAVWCYDSPARDTSNRPEFLEKQILEWDPLGNTIPPAAAAFALLQHASTFDYETWGGQCTAPSWENQGYSLPLLPQMVDIDRVILNQAISEACGFWARQPAGVVEQLFAGIEGGRRPVLIQGLEKPLPPSALASLLLPLPRSQGETLSIAGWLPAETLDETGSGRWDLIFSKSRNAPDYPDSITSRLRAASLISCSPELASGPQPWVHTLIEFAESPARWLEFTKLPGAQQPSAIEMDYIEQALRKVRAECARKVALNEDLADARKRHLEYKCDVIEAACCEVYGRRYTGKRVAEVRELWRKG